ncbi:LD-carboxypeptidase [Rhodoferax saidenbachensis]|uniref:Muramoyltetrapeptide carboxypeptidase n=1 Tax=Rhodoferax saidenbachensis TaxID=1484693 RepID=A0ABU1ZI28_9BURK|nr:LD-carboxypeptidase [Rhodoferax saidenbachensis]MDR7305189.1 muramoyltetrapeptide carboxypeptidase [Rhodoferax saidenbachensis]
MKKRIYIYSPSGAVRDKVAFKRGVKRLNTLGYDVDVDNDALASSTRFAGDDSTRLAAIHRAAASGADVALISRGGYGLTRILQGIRYKTVAKAIERGTQFVGISDFTAFQLALFAKTGAETWAGPALCEGFGVGGEPDLVPDDIMEDCFEDLVSGQGEGTGWRQDKTPGAVEALNVHGAMVWGGNLTVLASMLGTPFFPEIKGGILFLEDIGEHPYRIERTLTQLLNAGVIGRQKAILLGQFTGYKLTPHDRGYKLQSVVDWLRGQTKVPVLTNLPYGHVQTKVLLPVGKKADLVVEGRDALLFWGH